MALIGHIFLVGSSLAFLAPAAMAAKKKLASEAFVLFFTAFQVTMFHLCQVPLLALVRWVIGAKLLKYFSTYSLVLSIFTVLVAATRFDPDRKRAICTSGGLMAALRVYHNPEGYGSWSAPVTTACLLLAISWGKEMYRSKSIYPEKQKWLRFVMPAFCLGSLSLALRFIVQNSWNHPVTHTLHHLTLAAALTLLVHVVDAGGSKSKSSSSPGGAADVDCNGVCCCLACLC